MPISFRTLSQYTPTQRLVYWILERDHIRRQKEEGVRPPWTDDHILSGYRFCNVRREHDRVTRWIAQNWRNPHKNSPYLVHAMIIARFLNWPPTLQHIGWPEPWETKSRIVYRRLLQLKLRGDKVFTGAYIVSTNGATGGKIEYLMELFDATAGTRFPTRGTLAGLYDALMAVNGIGSFMAAQVIADVKQVYPLRNATDWHDWCAPGPGSKRGLNRVLGREVRASWPAGKHEQFREALRDLWREIAPRVQPVVGELCMQDLQNCLCEFDKYERARLGEGRPRSTYTPAAQDSLF